MSKEQNDTPRCWRCDVELTTSTPGMLGTCMQCIRVIVHEARHYQKRAPENKARTNDS